MKFTGVMTALITPFKNGKVDFDSLAKLVEQQVKGGVNGFVVNGTTAESPTLSVSEVKEMFKFIREKVGRDFPLIVGTGTNSTEQTIDNTKAAAEMGADAVLVVVPYYNKPPQRGLIKHFQLIADQSKVPVILYNVPGRTITSLTVESIAELAKHKNIIAIKEAAGNIEFVKQMKAAVPADFICLSGDDATYVEFLAAGGAGVISVGSHILPRQFADWTKWAKEGKIEEARASIKKYTAVIDGLFCESNPIPVKKALQLMGISATAELRLPLVELTPELTTKLQALMKEAGVL